MSLGQIGAALAIGGHLPYIWLIVRGTVRPHRVSWFVWSVILALAILGYRASGASDSIWFLVGDFTTCVTIFALSVWRGYGVWSRLDGACLGVALLSLVLWKVSSIPVFVLWGVLIADIIAVVPTLRKSLVDPGSEAASGFMFSSLAALCGLLAVGEWRISLLFYPAYLFVINLITATVVWVGQYHARRLAAQADAN